MENDSEQTKEKDFWKFDQEYFESEEFLAKVKALGINVEVNTESGG